MERNKVESIEYANYGIAFLALVAVLIVCFAIFN